MAPGLTYSGRDGSLYRQTPSAGWQRNTGSTWQTVPRTQAPALEQHAVSHSMGEQRFNNFRSFGGGFSHPAGALPMQAAAVTAKSTFASLPVQRPNFVESNLATAFIGIALENLG